MKIRGDKPAVLLLLLVFPFCAVYAQTGPAGPRDLFDQVLRAHVTDGRVDYPAIKRDPRFSGYLAALRETDADALATRQEKLAFWINAYNALAIKGILDGLSPASLFGRLKYFKLAKYDAGGKHINLYDLEREVIIPFGDPRIHFAIVCASRSCPKLRSEAYAAGRLDEQLNDNARGFINDAARNRFDVENKTAALSRIFDWFDDDFEQQAGSVQRYLGEYLEDPAAREAADRENFRIHYLKYDWNLNGIAPD